ncbi:MAG TPA: RNA-binding cell elongation regulator Jag/EloR [Acidimicrobiales bacterium]|nr:RNA-binding cell elongation regulator Jag/EloR [Acidimicrobiales bacterium]
MEWVETTGRTIEEAKEAALDELGVDQHDAEFEVVTEARLGLFGRLRSEARVRARVRPTAPRAKDDRRDRRRRRKSEPESDTVVSDAGGADARTGLGTGEKAPAGPSRRPRTSAPPRPTGDGTTGPSVTPSADALPSAGDADRPKSPGVNARSTDTQSGNGRRAGNGDGARSPRNERPARPGRTADSSKQSRPEEAGPVEVALEEQGQVAQDFLRGLMDELGLGAAIRVARPDEDTLELGLEGDDLGVLIGQKGATLFALQDLTRTVVQRRTGASNGRLLVDVGGYRQKRHQALARFAEQVAEQVRSSGSRRAMEPMNASDRKVVHDTINRIDGVQTTSEGEDPRRYVVVLPLD